MGEIGQTKNYYALLIKWDMVSVRFGSGPGHNLITRPDPVQ